jgi:hypothetical protein
MPGAKPFTRKRRASFFPRDSRGSALTVISFLMFFLTSADGYP